MQKHIYLDINNHKVAYSVSINNVELITNRFHQVPSKQLSINQWVYPGTNTFRVNISINPKWFEELKDQSFDMEILEYTGIRPDFSKNIIRKIEWHYEEDVTRFPVNFTGTIDLDVPYGDWLWRKAQLLDEETIKMDSLKEYIQNLHRMLKNKDYDSLAPLLSNKASELASAYYIPLEERLSDQKSFFTDELFTDSKWDMQPLDFERMRLISQAEGRIIEIFDKTGKNFLQSAPLEDATFSLPLRLCYYEGKWILCR
jgi:hypothetical protein